jgi:hypothetical protein
LAHAQQKQSDRTDDGGGHDGAIVSHSHMTCQRRYRTTCMMQMSAFVHDKAIHSGKAEAKTIFQWIMRQ